MARKLIVEIVGDAASLSRSFKGAEQATQGLGATIGRLSIGFGSLVKGVLVVDAVQAALNGLHTSARLATEEFADNAKVTAQTQAVLRSTGGIANVTAKQVDQLGLSLSNLSGVDDEVIRQSENLLLSFTNIRNYAGKNNDVFTRATKIVTDYSVRTGRDAAQAAIIFGRALEDPASRTASLSRAGVVLTGQQIKMIKAIEKSKGVLAAQRVLLKDLELRYQGAAKAAGQTLPGMLNVLRDRFKDLVGSGISRIQPALKDAVKGLTDFVRKLSEAQGTHAKISVAVEGLQNLGQDIGRVVQKLGRQIGDKLASIDWRSAITRAGQALGRGLVVSLNRIRDFLRQVNWNQVGSEIVIGLGKAIGAVLLFLKSVNFGKVAQALFSLLGAALKAGAALLAGIGQELGKALVRGIELSLGAVGARLERLAMKIVLKIIEPFTHLPSWLGGGPFQEMKRTLNASLAAMAVDGERGGAAIADAIAIGITQQGVAVEAAMRATVGKARAAVSGGTTPASLPEPPGPPLRIRKGLTAEQRNRFFDNEIARILLRGGLGDIQTQIGALEQANTLLEKRLQATKDVTRKLNLEDQILQNAAQIKSLQQQQQQTTLDQFISGLQLRVTEAQATKGLADDIGALKALEAGIQLEIRETGKTADLLSQLFDVRQQLAAARAAQITGRQFVALGLTTTGDTRVPGVHALKRELGSISDQIAGTFLDTSKVQSLLSRIRRVLSGGLGKVGEEVRAKIQEMLANLNQQLDQNTAKNVTKWQHMSSSAFLAGIPDLTPAQKRALQARFSTLGPGAVVPAGSSQAFALAGTTHVTTTVNLDGATVAKNTTKHQRRQNQRRTSSRRGPYAGRN